MPESHHVVAKLADVAALAGVSKGTASKALADRYDIGSETKARVVAAARQLNFRPNVLARGLGGKSTQSIGFITADYEARFIPAIMVGVEDALGADRSSVILSNTRDQADLEVIRVRDLLHRAVDGLILASPHGEARPSLQIPVPVPVVYVYGFSSDPTDSSVVADNEAGGRLAAEHLLQQGRRRIACITGPRTHLAAQKRLHGVMSALATEGLELVGSGAAHGDWSEHWGWTAAERLLDRTNDVDAIICGDDQIGRGVMDLLLMRGIDVPQQISVIGYDNWLILSERSRRPFSSIDANLPDIGRLAAQLVVAPQGPVPGLHHVAPRLVRRGTS